MYEKELFEAIRIGDLDAVKKWKEKGADLNARDEIDYLPIEVAAQLNKIDIVKYLINEGADLDDCDAAELARMWKKDFPTVNNQAIEHLILNCMVSHGYIEIEDGENIIIIINKLITTLLYEANRHGWDSKSCIELRSYLEYLNPGFIGMKSAQYCRYIEREETQNNTFYGSYLSDNSDSDEEDEFNKMDRDEKIQYYGKAQIYMERAQIKKLTYAKRTGNNVRGDLKEIKKYASEIFKSSARTTIHFGENVDRTKITRDLNHLNLLLKRKVPIEDAIAQLQVADPTFTKFFVAEYRGITYLTTKWNQPSRKQHRDDEYEIGEPQYSVSVMKAANLDFFRSYSNAKLELQKKSELVSRQAALLREILLTTREPKPYSYRGYTYSSLANLLQNIYTQDYDGFHQIIKIHPVLKHLLLNDANPFFSMGDTPYHAEKYAHGIKPYKGHESFRLRPRWRQDGRAERPYSGVVYASLHPLTDFTQEGPLHLISLNRTAEIKLNAELETISERESCFPAYLTAGRIFHKHKAKYPSFKGPYKRIYYYKYGLTDNLYEKFKIKLQNARPHTPEMKAFKKLLGEWLCSFHEVKLIDKAREEAERRGGVLIYRDIEGTFSFTPPVDSVDRQTNLMTLEIQTPVKNKQRKRAALSPPYSPGIETIGDENSIDEIMREFALLNLSDDGQSADIFTEGNSKLSMPFSLLLNAVREGRHLALEHYLKIEIFAKEINTTFNTWRLEKATLLHLAVLRNDINAVRMLLEVPGIDVNAAADETTNDKFHGGIYYENVTPVQLAVMEGYTELASLLLKHPQTKLDLQVSYVANKDLLGYLFIEPDENDDEDFLGFGSYCRESWPITRTRNNNLLHISAEQNGIALLDALLSKKISINAENSDHETPLDLMLRDKKYLLAAKLVDAGATTKSINFYLTKINFAFRSYLSKHHQNPGNIPSDIFEFLCALKRKKISLFTKEELESFQTFGGASKGYSAEIARSLFLSFDENTLKKVPAVCKSWQKAITDLTIEEKQINELQVAIQQQLKI